MVKLAGRLLFLCGVIVALCTLFEGPRGAMPVSYDAAALIGLSCKELGERHEAVIAATHDAEIAHVRRTGAFHDDLGLPREAELPFVVVMLWVMQENGLTEADLTPAPSALTGLQRTAFYSEASGICASEPFCLRLWPLNKRL